VAKSTGQEKGNLEEGRPEHDEVGKSRVNLAAAQKSREVLFVWPNRFV
jgi:hypothetical protein